LSVVFAHGGGSEEDVLDYIAPALLATLALFFSFLLTGISFLRERSQGTMERLMASPVSRLDMVVGYLLGFFIFALTQTLIVVLFTIYVLDVNYSGDLWQIFIFQIVVIVVAVNLGIFTSTFARNEFQMVQFIPLIIVPQVFLCGVIWPVEQMPSVIKGIAEALPFLHAMDATRSVITLGAGLETINNDLLYLVGWTVAIFTIGIILFRRSMRG